MPNASDDIILRVHPNSSTLHPSPFRGESLCQKKHRNIR